MVFAAAARGSDSRGGFIYLFLLKEKQRSVSTNEGSALPNAARRASNRRQMSLGCVPSPPVMAPQRPEGEEARRPSPPPPLG